VDRLFDLRTAPARVPVWAWGALGGPRKWCIENHNFSLLRQLPCGFTIRRKSRDGLWRFAAVYDGATRSEPAKIGGFWLQLVRDWVVQLNARGPGGPLRNVLR
jgi:hypothetical protein